MNRKTKQLIVGILVFLVIIGLYQFAFPGTPNIQDVSISRVKELIQQDKVTEIKVDGAKVLVKTKDGQELRTYLEKQATLSDYGITPESAKISIENPNKGELLPNFLSVILPFLLIAAFLYFMFRSAQGANMKAMSFGKSRAQLYQGKNKVTFQDVAGADEAKQELREIVEFLRYPEKFHRLGAEIPKGVLLVGPPGTGKTLIARAVAGEAKVPFFSVSASEFVEMFVGVGAARTRDAFLKAKRNAPAILFIDELDAIGRQRGSGLGGSHDEREQTLNQILVEMDGFDTNTKVVVMAATNRPDVLDPALLRPGRFDRRIILDLPDRRARRKILEIHLKNKPVARGVDINKVARGTAGFSGADLKNVANEAAIYVARQNKTQIHQSDLNWAVEKVLLGPERRSRILTEEEKKITAYHEAGHAIVGHLLPQTDSIHKISIISRGRSLGYTWSLPEEDFHLYSKEKFENQLAQFLAGRAAEELKFHSVTTGAANDLQEATKLARNMVTRYGMSEKLGPITLGEREELIFLGKELAEHKTYSEQVAAKIDNEVAQLINRARQQALNLLKKHRRQLDELANRLLKQETVEGKELASLFVKSANKRS